MGDNDKQVQAQYRQSWCMPTPTWRPALVNMAMMNTSPFSVWNLNMNLAVESCITDSLMYRLPTFSSGYYPLMGGYGMSGGGEIKFPSVEEILKNCKFNFNFGGVPGMNNGVNGNNGVGSGRIADPKTPEEKEFNKYYDMFKKFYDSVMEKKDGEYVTSESVRSYISDMEGLKAALNKSGKVEERLKALKDFKDTLSDAQIRFIISVVEKSKLDQIGYNFAKGGVPDMNAQLKADMKKAENCFQDLVVKFGTSANEKDVVPYLSAWNSATKKSLLLHTQENLKNDTTKEKVENQKDHKAVIHYAVNNLISYASDVAGQYYANTDKEMTEMKNYIKALEDSYKATKLSADDENTVDLKKVDLKQLDRDFNNLYVAIRRYEAKAVNAKTKESYEFLSKKSVVNDDLFVKQTEEDLKEEFGSKYSEYNKVKTDEVKTKKSQKVDGETPAKQFESLQGKNGSEKSLEKTASSKIFKSAGVNTKYYAMKDGSIIELTNVKEVKPNGKCVVVTEDGEKELMAEEAIADEANGTVEADSIKEYSRNARKTEELIKKANLSATAIKGSNGEVIYKSTGKKEYTYKETSEGEEKKFKAEEYFVVKDGKLHKLPGFLSTNSAHSGEVATDGGYISLDDAIESSEECMDEDNIMTKAKEDKAAKEAEAKKKEEEKNNPTKKKNSEDKTVEEFAEEQGMTATKAEGYYTKGDKVYKYDEDKKQFVEMPEGTTIDENGKICKKGRTVGYDPDTEAVGKKFASQIIGSTDDNEYEEAKNCLNEVKMYDNAEDIANFFIGYKKDLDSRCRGDEICEQIVTEGWNTMHMPWLGFSLRQEKCFTNKQKFEYLKMFAQKLEIWNEKAKVELTADETKLLSNLKTSNKTEDYNVKTGKTFDRFTGQCDYGTNKDIEILKHIARILDGIINKIITTWQANHS